VLGLSIPLMWVVVCYFLAKGTRWRQCHTEYPQRTKYMCWCIFTTWGHLRITWFPFFPIQANHEFKGIISHYICQKLWSFFLNPEVQETYIIRIFFSPQVGPTWLVALLSFLLSQNTGPTTPPFPWAQHQGLLCTKNFHTCQNRT
jgi:hypothetical protein